MTSSWSVNLGRSLEKRSQSPSPTRNPRRSSRTYTLSSKTEVEGSPSKASSVPCPAGAVLVVDEGPDAAVLALALAFPTVFGAEPGAPLGPDPDPAVFLLWVLDSEGRSRDASYVRAMRSARGTSSISSRSKQEMFTREELLSARASGRGAAMVSVSCRGESHGAVRCGVVMTRRNSDVASCGGFSSRGFHRRKKSALPSLVGSGGLAASTQAAVVDRLSDGAVLNLAGLAAVITCH